MKTSRILYSAIVLFALTLFLTSCEKDDILSETEISQQINEEESLTSRSTSKCNALDFYALKRLYNNTGGGVTWAKSSTWDIIANNATCPPGGDLSVIRDLRLHPNGRVRTLKVSGLSGTLDASLQYLQEIIQIEISRSPNLTGSIPPELGKLTNLFSLMISECALTGTIPAEIGNLTKLTHLRFDNNQLTGSVPASLGELPYSVYLTLNNNNLSGCYPASFQKYCEQRRAFWGKHLISNGNNFDASMEDYCASGAGGC